MTLATVSPAAAATGSWVAYGNTNPITSSNSTWKCASTKTVTTNVLAQVCAIRSPDGRVEQGAVIVRNNRSTTYGVEAAVDLSIDPSAPGNTGFIDRWTCSRSGVAAHSWS